MERHEITENDRRLQTLLSTIPETQIPGDLTQRILARAQATAQRRGITGYTGIVQAWWKEATPALRAAAVFVLVAGLSLGTAMSLKVTQQITGGEHPLGVYGLDNFSGTPEGSLEQAYLALLEPSHAGGQ